MPTLPGAREFLRANLVDTDGLSDRQIQIAVATLATIGPLDAVGINRETITSAVVASALTIGHFAGITPIRGTPPVIDGIVAAVHRQLTGRPL